MVSEREKQIYNSYLYATRSAKNQPTKFRKDFSKLKDQDFVSLKKLSGFFKKHTHINYRDWFAAPFEVYSKDEYFDLQFFNTRKALKCYSLYMKERETSNPDTEENIANLKQGLRFIYNYCIDNNMSVDEYRTHITGNMPTCLLHLQEHRLSFYLLHALDVEKTIKSVENSILNFIVQDFHTVFARTRTKFSGSATYKLKAKDGITKIKTIVETKQK